ncbi:MAG: PIN domain-containing protein [Deltaproteobacteria bacterium]|nr:PIN domain-containing protein [Deltaproteobacteria bacterium]
MSCSIDVNLMVEAVDAEGPRFARAQAFLFGVARDAAPVSLAWITLLSFVRMTTHRGILKRPLTHAQACENVSALLALPQVRTIEETDGFWDAYREVTRDLDMHGKHVPDAHLAALLKVHGIRRFYTRDADFRRYRFLDVVDPLV